MKLHTIDKAVYRKRLNIALVSAIAILLISSLAVSNILIMLYGSSVDGDNFWWNLSGVAVGAAIVASIFKLMVNKPFMAEINYVRKLKRELNRIYRSSGKLNPAIEANNETALTISYFNLQASKQVYQLDNNTLTLDDLNENIRALDEKLETLGLNISVEDYNPELLSQL